MDINALFDRKNLEIDFGNETLHLGYRPQIVTPAWWEKLKALDEGAEQTLTALGDLLVSWDLTAGGQAVPTTIEALAGLPTSFLNQVLAAVIADLMPPPPRPDYEDAKR